MSTDSYLLPCPYSKNTTLRSADIGKAIGRSRQTVDAYIAELRAATQLGLDIKISRMDRLGIPQERIAKRLGAIQRTVSKHLGEMLALANILNTDLSKGFTVSRVAEKHGWTEPMVWTLALEGKEDLERFKELGWWLRTWDLWNWNDCLPRETHVNDSEAYFTGATNVSETIGRAASRLK